MHEQVTIDGPASSGKSTVAAQLAKRLNFTFLSSGQFYRIVAFYLAKNNADLQHLDESNFAIEIDGLIDLIDCQKNQVFLNHEEITNQLQTEEIGKITSQISKFPFVREYVNDVLNHLAENKNIVIDGRDMGSVVFPYAKVKFYLTASVQIRAKRRYEQLKQTHQNTNLEQIEYDLALRDYQDEHRTISPLVIPKQAIVINSDDLSVEQVVQKMYEIVQKLI